MGVQLPSAICVLWKAVNLFFYRCQNGCLGLDGSVLVCVLITENQTGTKNSARFSMDATISINKKYHVACLGIVYWLQKAEPVNFFYRCQNGCLGSDGLELVCVLMTENQTATKNSARFCGCNYVYIYNQNVLSLMIPAMAVWYQGKLINCVVIKSICFIFPPRLVLARNVSDSVKGRQCKLWHTGNVMMNCDCHS